MALIINFPNDRLKTENQAAGMKPPHRSTTDSYFDTTKLCDVGGLIILSALIHMHVSLNFYTGQSSWNKLSPKYNSTTKIPYCSHFH